MKRVSGTELDQPLRQVCPDCGKVTEQTVTVRQARRLMGMDESEGFQDQPIRCGKCDLRYTRNQQRKMEELDDPEEPKEEDGE